MNPKTPTPTAADCANMEEGRVGLESTIARRRGPHHHHQHRPPPREPLLEMFCCNLTPRQVGLFVLGWVLGTCLECFLFQCFTDSQIVQLVVTRSMVWCTVLLVLLAVTKFCLPGYFMTQIFCAVCWKQDIEDHIDILFESEHNDEEDTLFLDGFVNGLDKETPCSSCQEADHQGHCKVRSSSFTRHHEKTSTRTRTRHQTRNPSSSG